jgi:hypothetical protein
MSAPLSRFYDIYGKLLLCLMAWMFSLYLIVNTVVFKAEVKCV